MVRGAAESWASSEISSSVVSLVLISALLSIGMLVLVFGRTRAAGAIIVARRGGVRA